MTTETKECVIEFSCRKKPSTPEEHKEIQDRIDDLYSLTGMDKLRAFYEWKGLEFDESIFDDIFADYPLEDSSFFF